VKVRRRAHACGTAASETKSIVRNRYVLQVLLATFGFGIILAVIAALQNPADRSLEGTGATRRLAESPQCHPADPPTQAPKSAPRTDDLKDDCEFPTQLI